MTLEFLLNVVRATLQNFVKYGIIILEAKVSFMEVSLWRTTALKNY